MHLLVWKSIAITKTTFPLSTLLSYSIPLLFILFHSLFRTKTGYMMKKTDTISSIFSRPISDSTKGLRPWPKSGRKPLQPKNDFSNNNNSSETQLPTVKSKPNPILASILNPSNKENLISSMTATPLPEGAKFHVKIINIEPFEASLAEELSAIRKKMERLKLDKYNTDNLLKERDLMLDMQMNHLQSRGEAQKHLENQVDRLFRLNELRLSCMKITPIQSLREKEENKIKLDDGQQKKLSINDSNSDTKYNNGGTGW